MAAQAVMRCCGTQAYRLSVLCNQQAPSIIATSRQAIARGCQQRQPRLWLGASQPTARHATVLSASKAESRGAGGNEAKGSGQKQPKREELSGKGSPDPRDAAGKTKAKQDDTEEDGFLDEDGLEYEEGEYDEDEEGGEYDEDEEDEGEDDYAESFLEPDDAVREVATGGTAWGDAVLKCAQEVLCQPNMQNLQLYLFRTLPGSKKVDIRLDKMDDLYGSPSIDDIERFSRALFAALDRELGVEAAGEISFEVSSPGAERLVEVPGELNRFAELPLRVEYRSAEGKECVSVLLLDELDEAGGSTTWRLANVRANATVKGRALSKKQLSQKTTIPVANITRVRIHVDF